MCSYSVANGERKAQLRQRSVDLGSAFDVLSIINIFARMTSRFNRFEAGDVVAIPFGVGLSHYGIVTSRGTVISNSRKHGGVVEQSLAEFSNGRRIRLCESTDPLDAAVSESRARRAKGSPYSLTGSNCAHFTRWSRRQRPTTMQVASATASAFADMLFGPKRRC